MKKTKIKKLKGIPATKVNATYTQEMVDEISKMGGIDIVSKMEDILVDEIQKAIEKERRKEIYDRRKRIIDKLLK